MCEAKEMEGELKNFIRFCVLTLAFLLYSYFIAAKIPKGLLRLISILPVITLLSILPFDLNSFHIGSATWFLVAWLANFKLLLFAFDQGPLSVPKHDLLCFILTACFPFKIKQNPSPKKPFETKTNLILEAATRATIVSTVVYAYNNYEHYFHKHILFIYCFYIYHALQFLLALAASSAQLLLGVELEPQFNAPLLSTSLQDFWGHRWNLRVSELLRATVYIPAHRISTRIIGPRWPSLPAVFLTFFVSGLMHELLVYHMTRERPTWEMTWFFILQGVFVDMEIVLKKKLVATNKFRLHRAISGPLALANIAVTAGWLSYTQILRNGIDEKLIKEFNMFMPFLKGHGYKQILSACSTSQGQVHGL
ncbi:probable long-chain-alcohol O-fatty-acyltransferase 1 [Herrania umbratica]|uniref:Probable long-chain-alcohol O-fatty-acyltransferase 1 n=1 Tax=Herrania umbratica TaxID=108875 RepID=A0A6J1BIS7_9ROSI|nr:probable long-chain-alcohol O-fatty-acyltransferase 1 [Herrania umbratica]